MDLSSSRVPSVIGRSQAPSTVICFRCYVPKFWRPFLTWFCVHQIWKQNSYKPFFVTMFLDQPKSIRRGCFFPKETILECRIPISFRLWQNHGISRTFCFDQSGSDPPHQRAHLQPCSASFLQVHEALPILDATASGLWGDNVQVAILCWENGSGCGFHLFWSTLYIIPNFINIWNA